MGQESKKIKSFQDLIAWQEGHNLVVAIYEITRHFPKTEQFGLSNQMQRAVTSITSNIAEGFSRRSYKEKIQFYSMALGSLSEVQSQLLIARDIGYTSKERFEEISDKAILTSKLLNGLLKKSRIILNS